MFRVSSMVCFMAINISLPGKICILNYLNMNESVPRHQPQPLFGSIDGKMIGERLEAKNSDRVSVKTEVNLLRMIRYYPLFNFINI